MSQIWKFDEIFSTTKYPSGEFHLKLNRVPWQQNTIVANAVDFNGLAKCVVGDRILSRLNISVDWVIPFFPFARDDRRNTAYDGMELKLALDLVKELGAAVVDPHSDVTTQGVKFFPQDEVVREFTYNGFLNVDNPIVAIPDAGAAKKAYSWIAEHNLEYVQCLKKRDTVTGRLSGFSIPDGLRTTHRDVIIVDDICDGGGTFIGLAEELNKYNPSSMTLAVTHGLFTKGVEDLSNEFDRIYTLDHLSNYLDDYKQIEFCSLNEIIKRGNAI